jgi:hypothetical protein
MEQKKTSGELHVLPGQKHRCDPVCAFAYIQGRSGLGKNPAREGPRRVTPFLHSWESDFAPTDGLELGITSGLPTTKLSGVTLFGLIDVPGRGIYFVDDGSNTLNLFH